MTAAAPEPAGPLLRVVCATAGRELSVPRGTSILEAVRRAGLAVPPPCRDARCGACETRVLDGEPDHRDGVLTAEERAFGETMMKRAFGETMMICVSGARTARLVLDL